MPQNDFICQNIFKCSKTIFDQVLKFIYGLKDLVKSLVNYRSEKHFENAWNGFIASFDWLGVVDQIWVVDRPGWSNQLVLQWLVQQRVSYDQPPVWTGWLN